MYPMSVYRSPESQSDPDAARDDATHSDVARADVARDAGAPLAPSEPQGARVARNSLAPATLPATEPDAGDALRNGDTYNAPDAFTTDDLVAGAFADDGFEGKPFADEAPEAEHLPASLPDADDASASLAEDEFHSNSHGGFKDAFHSDSAPDAGYGGYGGPPLNGYHATDGAASPDPAPHGVSSSVSNAAARDKEQDLFEHLGELRTRLLRCVIAVGLVMVATWSFRDALLAWFAAPIGQEVRKKGGELITINPAEGFTLYLQITFAAALLIAMPIVLHQIWAFVEPALTHQERRYGAVLVPFSVALFFAGAGLGFYLTPLFFKFFLEFQPPGTVANWSYGAAAMMLAKMLLVFGICFQVPVVTVFVNKIGLVSRNWLIEYWRHVVVVMFIVVAIITPTWDPITLTAAALPPCLLYAFSIWLIKWL